MELPPLFKVGAVVWSPDYSRHGVLRINEIRGQWIRCDMAEIGAGWNEREVWIYVPGCLAWEAYVPGCPVWRADYPT